MNVGDAVPVLRIASSTSHPSRHEQSRHDEGCEHDDVEIGDEINCPAKRESLIKDQNYFIRSLLISSSCSRPSVMAGLTWYDAREINCSRPSVMAGLTWYDARDWHEPKQRQVENRNKPLNVRNGPCQTMTLSCGERPLCVRIPPRHNSEPRTCGTAPAR